MLNVTAFQGRVSQDVVLAYTPTKIPYCRLRIAVERDYTINGERKTDFLSCIAWRETAHFAARNFTKGSMILVRGRLEEEVWKDKEGNTRSRMIVNVDNLYFGETKRAREEREQRRAGNAEMPPLPDDEDIPPELLDDAQLPF
ncbi:MAG: single-stranded DNA-binding protein [Oscillospiraceae bacterium]|nr:single-stranded DNA-binding protein [Oscillospiraceae bacterium]